MSSDVKNAQVLKALAVALFISSIGAIFIAPFMFGRLGPITAIGGSIVGIPAFISAYAIWNLKIWAPLAFLSFICAWLALSVTRQVFEQGNISADFMVPTLISAIVLLAIFAFISLHMKNLNTR
ncbi:MAG TPA: hypothetical protein VLG68_02525 [Gammaproteobacteria bacterium]|nr:hypothetical protein [Gammaproteobacteria bacterium]